MQLLTLYRRRLRLLAGNPRELIVPLATPVLFAIVIGPALKKALGSFNPRVDYLTFVSIATVVLLVPGGPKRIAERAQRLRRPRARRTS